MHVLESQGMGMTCNKKGRKMLKKGQNIGNIGQRAAMGLKYL